jgi:hypothetical protein
MKGTTVHISNPTWGNHRNIFGDEGVEWKYYRCIQLTAPSAAFASRNSTRTAWLRRCSKQKATLLLVVEPEAGSRQNNDALTLTELKAYGLDCAHV